MGFHRDYGRGSLTSLLVLFTGVTVIIELCRLMGWVTGLNLSKGQEEMKSGRLCKPQSKFTGGEWVALGSSAAFFLFLYLS